MFSLTMPYTPQNCKIIPCNKFKLSMNLKLSAGLWSSKNSLLNKLLLGHSKYLTAGHFCERKRIFPVCAIYPGLNFVAIDAKSVNSWIIQGLLRLELPKAQVHDWILIPPPAAFVLSYKGHGEVIIKSSLCQLLQTASSPSFILMVFFSLWPSPSLHSRDVWLYICLKRVALLCPSSTADRINWFCNLINICYMKRELSHWPGAPCRHKMQAWLLVIHTCIQPVKGKDFCKGCTAHVVRSAVEASGLK